MADHPPRRGDRANPHSGDCTGTRCPVCDCCMHCPANDDHECPTCTGCSDPDCECPAQQVLRVRSAHRLLAEHPAEAPAQGVADQIAQTIRVVDGDHTMGAGALGEHVAAALAPLLANVWDEGFKQGGPMHDVNYDDPDAHTRNPYRDRADREAGADQ